MTLNPKIINLPSLGFVGSVSEACRKFNVPLHVFSSRRYHLKWDIEKCFATPVRKKTCFRSNLLPEEIHFYFENEKQYKFLPEIIKEFKYFIKQKTKSFKYFTSQDVEKLKEFKNKEVKECVFETKYLSFKLIDRN